jgi:DNA-binding NarL/FixJ family response regulator
VGEALSLGTCGYVVKSKAEHDLLATVDAVLEGSQFLSGAFAGAIYWRNAHSQQL